MKELGNEAKAAGLHSFEQVNKFLQIFLYKIGFFLTADIISY